MIMIKLSRTIVVIGLAMFLSVHGHATNQKDHHPRIKLKAAKLIIEHNATDKDTGFQGFVDSDGWQNMTIKGPEGNLLELKGLGKLGHLGLTELFFETVEPDNKEISVVEMLKLLPEGTYTFTGQAMESGQNKGRLYGEAVLTHTIPAGPILLTPRKDEIVSSQKNLKIKWTPVKSGINGEKVNIIAYQLIIQKEEASKSNMIFKMGLDMILPAEISSISIPHEFLESDTSYEWQVLAIEESGNQTISSSVFHTR